MSTHPVVISKHQAEAAGFWAAVDLDRLASGTSFQATWTFINTGTTTENGRYRFVYTLTPHNETAGFPCSPMGLQSAWAIEDIDGP